MQVSLRSSAFLRSMFSTCYDSTQLDTFANSTHNNAEPMPIFSPRSKAKALLPVASFGNALAAVLVPRTGIKRCSVTRHALSS